MRRFIKWLPLLLLFTCVCFKSEAQADTIDLVGDTFGTGAVQHDITSINAVFDNSAIIFTVRFAGAISPASSGGERALAGFIDIDTDQDAATGIPPAINEFAPGPPISLGEEFFIDLFSEEFLVGRVDILNEMFDLVGNAPITFSTKMFSVTVPLSLLGGDDGLVNYGVVVGTFDEPTDRAPNGVVPATSTPVPEPTTMLLLGTGLAGIGGMIRKRRQAKAELRQ